jgi:signal transduction histidine kinase
MRSVLHRVAQEALVNVVRHAQARVALVSLRHSSAHIDLVVQDDGVGAPELLLQHYTESTTHFGLKGMRRMVEEIGGQFTVANGDESGLAIRVRVPLPADTPA